MGYDSSEASNRCKSTQAVSTAEVEIVGGAHLVLLLESYNVRQGAHLALHAVDALHEDQDLLPRPTGARLALADAFPQQPLQVCDVIVRYHLQIAAESSAVHCLNALHDDEWAMWLFP